MRRTANNRQMMAVRLLTAGFFSETEVMASGVDFNVEDMGEEEELDRSCGLQESWVVRV